MSSLILPTQKRFIRHDDKPPFGFKLNKKHKLAQGLVGAWLMNEYAGNTVYDLSGNGNHGTINDADWVAGGLDFPGSNNYINCGDGTDLHFESNFTISQWVKTDTIVSYDSFFSKGESTSNTYHNYLSYRNTDTSFKCSIGNEVTYDITPAIPLSKGVLHNIIFKVDDDFLYVYVDNIQKAKTTRTVTGLTGANKKLLFGAWSTTSYNDYNGFIYYTLIYNRALSASDIAQLHRTPYAFFQPKISPAGLYIPAVGGVAPTSTLYGPFYGPMAGPIGIY